jgi:ActR/RegA family two-component response regulator
MTSVLLVEHEATVGETVAQALRTLGLRVEVTQTVEGAYSRLLQSEFDIVVTDCRKLPKADFLSEDRQVVECIRVLRAARAHTRIFVYSGLDRIAQDIQSVIPPDDPHKHASASHLASRIRLSIDRNSSNRCR